MQQSKGSMGSHKHGTSGHTGPHGKVKAATARTLNEESARREEQRRKQTSAGMKASLKELFGRK